MSQHRRNKWKQSKLIRNGTSIKREGQAKPEEDVCRPAGTRLRPVITVGSPSHAAHRMFDSGSHFWAQMFTSWKRQWKMTFMGNKANEQCFTDILNVWHHAWAVAHGNNEADSLNKMWRYCTFTVNCTNAARAWCFFMGIQLTEGHKCLGFFRGNIVVLALCIYFFQSWSWETFKNLN